MNVITPAVANTTNPTIVEEIVPGKISNLVKRQFPDWYHENGPTFVAFVQAYYQWMESENNPLYYQRGIYDIQDIDRTYDEFVVFFKEKFLKNIQLDTKTNVRRIVKHALDIYRSKGSQRSVKLLFQLVFNKDVKFYYPSTDLFRLSDGEWFKPTYLELRLSGDNILVIGKEVQGLSSGAVGFVDQVVRRTTQGRFQDIAYISAIFGNFEVGEIIIPTDETLDIKRCPVIVGSLTQIELSVSGVGDGFANGDVVTINSQYGEGGKGVVTETIEQFGTVDAELVDGGYGYRGVASVTANSTVDTIYISNTMFDFSNLQITVPGSIQYFQQFDVFTQTQIYYNFNSSNGVFFANNDIYTYHANNLLKGHGIVLSAAHSNSSAGTLRVGVISGNLDTQLFFTVGNAIVGNINSSNGFAYSNATGKFMANDNFISLEVNNISGSFGNGEVVFQPSAVGVLKGLDDTGTMTITNIQGIFLPNYNVTGLLSGATCNVTSLSIGVGVSNTNQTFYDNVNVPVTCNSVSGYISRVERGSGFAISVSNNLLFPETVRINTDLLTGYLSTNINAASYGFPANSSANLTSVTIDGSLSYQNVTIGKIEKAFVAGVGVDYTKPPFIVLDAPAPRALQYHNYWIDVVGVIGTFADGDLVTQGATNARGYVLEANNSVIRLQNLRFYQNNRFVVTSNSTTTLMAVSGGVANATVINYDDDPDVMGHNFNMPDSFTIGEGAIANLTVIDSGFGFMPDEEVIFNGNSTLVGVAKVINQGVGTGYYRTKGGFASDQKKLFDGVYWQNYSYEIISSLTINKFEKMLKQITHPAGTIMFGKLQHDTVANAAVSAANTTIDTATFYTKVVPTATFAVASTKTTSRGRGKVLSVHLTETVTRSSTTRNSYTNKSINLTLAETVTRSGGKAKNKTVSITLLDTVTRTSTTFDMVTFTGSNATVTSNAATAPDGTTTATKLIENTATALHYAYEIFAKPASNIQYKLIVWVKAPLAPPSGRYIEIGAFLSSAGVYMVVEGTSGIIVAPPVTAGGYSGASGVVEAAANGFWKVTLTFTSNSDTEIRPYVGMDDHPYQSSYTGDGANYILYWGELFRPNV